MFKKPGSSLFQHAAVSIARPWRKYHRYPELPICLTFSPHSFRYRRSHKIIIIITSASRFYLLIGLFIALLRLYYTSHGKDFFDLGAFEQRKFTNFSFFERFTNQI